MQHNGGRGSFKPHYTAADLFAVGELITRVCSRVSQRGCVHDGGTGKDDVFSKADCLSVSRLASASPGSAADCQALLARSEHAYGVLYTFWHVHVEKRGPVQSG